MSNFKVDNKQLAFLAGGFIAGFGLNYFLNSKSSSDKSNSAGSGTKTSSQKTLTVCITGAAGNIGYNFVPLVANGAVFGPNTLINLKLLDIEKSLGRLQGMAMELDDGAYPNLVSVSCHSQAKEAFVDCDVVVFIGGFPRQKGQERKALLKINGKIFSEQGQALQEVGKETVRCLVVANPANTNCWILRKNAPKIPAENFTALTRLDENRAYSQLAQRLKGKVTDFKNVFIWGNHSKTQYPDVSHATFKGKGVDGEIKNRAYTEDEFVKKIQNRGGEILDKTGLTSIFSAANAVKDHLRDWYLGAPDHHSQAVVSNGQYGVQKDLVFSYPVHYKGDWKYEVIESYKWNDFSEDMIKITQDELKEEIADYEKVLEEEKAAEALKKDGDA